MMFPPSLLSCALLTWLVVLPSISCSQDSGVTDRSPGASPRATSDLEQQAFNRINKYRVSKGLAALEWSDAIAAQARRHSQDMASGAVAFGHDGFDGRARVIGRTTPWRTASENVAMSLNEPDPVAAAVADWLNSPEHRVNVEGDFNLTGVGAATARNGAIYLTQIFIRSRF